MINTGNPWVFLGLSVPVSACTHTPEEWVQICMVFFAGMDMGRLSVGVGTDFKRVGYGYGFQKIKLRSNCNYYYTIIPQSSLDHVSSALASGRDAPTFKSSKVTIPNLLQYPRHNKARVDCTDKRLRVWEMRSRPLLNTRLTATDKAREDVLSKCK